jgi:hypothetical protein
MQSRLRVLVFVCAALLHATSMAQSADRRAFNGFDVRDALIPVERIERGGPPKDGIPAIDRPQFVAADKSDLRSDDRVLGLVLDGVAKAYPVRILNWHEVVNDRLGDIPVAVTYCPLCGSGIAFDARLDMRQLNFGVSGLLFNSDVLLYDRSTESLWSQMKHLAVSGPLKGSKLNVLPLEHTTWSDWRARHPTTLVLSPDTGFARDYSHDPYAGYDRIQRLMFEVEHRDDRLALKEWVLGIEVGGARKAYPFSALAGISGRSGVLEVRDTVGGVPVIIRFDPQHRTAQALDTQRRPIPGVMSFWFAWVAFHPKTEVYRAP